MQTIEPAANPGTHMLVPFPTHRARPPSDPSLYDRATWDRCLLAAHFAGQICDFRDAAVDVLVDGVGTSQPDFDRIGDMLENSRFAIGFLRAVLASLTDADRCIAESASRLVEKEA